MTEKHVNTWSSWFDGEKVTADFMSDREQDRLLAENSILFRDVQDFDDQEEIASKGQPIDFGKT